METDSERRIRLYRSLKERRSPEDQINRNCRVIDFKSEQEEEMRKTIEPLIGFTLIEVLLASILLAVLIAGLGFFFTNIVNQSDMMDDQSRALEICRQEIEELRTVDMGLWPDDTTLTTVTIEKFDRYVVVSTPYPTMSSAKMAHCIVRWDGMNGPDSLSLSMIY